jgi:hypothetical protein
MPVCKLCQADKAVDEFEKQRSATGHMATCRACRSSKRAAKPKPAPKEPDQATMPTQCVTCGHGPPDVGFQWRTDKNSWRKECYTEKYRARQRAEDEVGYLRRNTETHQKWVMGASPPP